MIRTIKFSNFYSFKGEQEISFLANKKKTYDYFNSRSGQQITKIAGFAGANASGKTNIMRLFSFLSYFVCTSDKNDKEPGILFKTFFNNHRPAEFFIEFESEDQIYYYSFSVKDDAIISEKLSVKETDGDSYRNTREVYNRLGNVVSSNKAFFEAQAIPLIANIRPDISLIAFLNSNYNIDIINKVFRYFAGFRSNINERGEIDSDRHKGAALKTYLLEADIKEKAERFICDFDLGLSGFSLEEIENDNPRLGTVRVEGNHKGGRKLNFEYESSGTRKLIFSLADIFYALKYGGVVIIDELEVGFHPEALSKLLSYFIEENKDGMAQMIFSSHYLGFMNKLDMHQINLVGKNEKGESISYRLNQVENIRPDENFLAKYLSGSYGAFPAIRV